MRKRFTPRELRRLRIEAEQQYENIHGARFYRNVDFLLYILVVIMVALVIRAFFVEPIRVDGDSMLPTLHTNEYVFMEKVSYWFDEPGYGDIVICYYPHRTETFVKRVIGTSGDTIEIRDGTLYINGAADTTYFSGYLEHSMEPVIVPEHSVFVMGDNRNASMDSTNGSIGPLPVNMILGKALFVIWPFDQIRGL